MRDDERRPRRYGAAHAACVPESPGSVTCVHAPSPTSLQLAVNDWGIEFALVSGLFGVIAVAFGQVRWRLRRDNGRAPGRMSTRR